MKKFVSLLLSAALASSMFVTAFAAGGAPNAKWDAEDVTITAGDTFTVLVSTGEKAITTEGIGLTFDNTKLAVVSFTDGYDGEDYELEYVNASGKTRYKGYAVSDSAELANQQGQFGITFQDTTEYTYLEYDLAKVTFKAVDGFTGEATLKLEENSSGTDGYKGVVDSITVTVAGGEPAAPVVGTPSNDGDNAKVWAVTVAGDYVATKNGALDATLTQNDLSDTQEFKLNVNGIGEAEWTFNVRVTFTDPQYRANTVLTVE